MNAEAAINEFHSVAKICFLATCDGDRPRVRPMVAAAVEGSTVYFETHSESPKIDQIKGSPNVEISWVKPDWSHLRARGSAELIGDAETRRRVWDAFPEGKEYFTSPESPELAVIRVDVAEALHMPVGSMGYESIPMT